jgi:ribosomal protein L19E
MRPYKESWMKEKPDDLRENLRVLKRERLITRETYRTYLFLIRSASTTDQLKQLARDFSEIRDSRYRPLHP